MGQAVDVHANASGTEAPIGIFDSGFGGLTVARAVIDLLPYEDIVYLGDPARCPYGDQPIAQVREYALAVLDDLVDALDRLAPRDAGWRHDLEGPDDMPAHVKTMLTGASVSVPVLGGRLALGTWQAIYLVEHRDRPHRRELLLHFAGALAGAANR